MPLHSESAGAAGPQNEAHDVRARACAADEADRRHHEEGREAARPRHASAATLPGRSAPRRGGGTCQDSLPACSAPAQSLMPPDDFGAGWEARSRSGVLHSATVWFRLLPSLAMSCHLCPVTRISATYSLLRIRGGQSDTIAGSQAGPIGTADSSAVRLRHTLNLTPELNMPGAGNVKSATHSICSGYLSVTQRVDYSDITVT